MLGVLRVLRVLRTVGRGVMAAMIAGPAIAAPQDGPVPTAKGAVEEAAPSPEVDDSVVPPPQKEQLALFTGTWRCSGKANSDFGQDVPTTMTLTFKPDLGGRWIALRLSEQKSRLNPRAVTSSELWGYSEALGGLVRNGADNQGGFYSGSSSGWVGDRLWWTVDTVRNGRKAKLKDTFTKAGPQELLFERAIDVSGTGDGFRVMYEGSCRR